MTCTHHLYDATGLACQRTDAHDPAAVGGHSYQSTSGVPDAAKEEM